jgi:hypothetical protein
MSGHEQRGPVEDNAWPARLSARVASPGPRPAIHGYAIADDLARYYSFAEQTLLALTGVIPDEATGRAFEWAMQVLGATSVAQAPAHAAIVVRLCGASPGAAYAAGFMAATELATSLVDAHASLVSWLDGARPDFPAEHRGATEADSAIVLAARERLGELAVWAEAPTADAALLAILHRAGVRDAAQLVAAVSLAKLPVVMGEALAQRPLAFRGYPMDLPEFTLEENSRA